MFQYYWNIYFHTKNYAVIVLFNWKKFLQSSAHLAEAARPDLEAAVPGEAHTHACSPQQGEGGTVRGPRHHPNKSNKKNILSIEKYIYLFIFKNI